MKDYAINLFYSENDEAWIADIPDLFSCSASGDTPEAALREVQIAKKLWLDTAQEDGDIIPEPVYDPVLEASSRRQAQRFYERVESLTNQSQIVTEDLNRVLETVVKMGIQVSELTKNAPDLTKYYRRTDVTDIKQKTA